MGDEHGIEVDEYSIQKVEVLKGPASLFYGSDAMAGVVHLITNSPVEKGTIIGNILGTTNTNNGLYGTNANFAGHLKTGLIGMLMPLINQQETIAMRMMAKCLIAGIMREILEAIWASTNHGAIAICSSAILTKTLAW